MPTIKPSKKTKKKVSQIFNANTPLLGFSVIEIIILAVVIGGGTAAVAYRNTRNATPIETTVTAEKFNQPVKVDSTSPEKSIEPPANTPNSTQGSSSTNDRPTNNSSTNSPVPDSNGCTTESCRQSWQNINFMKQCDVKRDAANRAFDSIVNPALAAREAAIAEAYDYADNDPALTPSSIASIKYDAWQREIIIYNAKVAPAWDAYVKAYDAIQAEGCTRLQLYSNPTFP